MEWPAHLPLEGGGGVSSLIICDLLVSEAILIQSMCFFCHRKD